MQFFMGIVLIFSSCTVKVFSDVGALVRYLCIAFIIAKMLDMMFQHLGTVQCTLFMCLGLRALYLIKEFTPYFLLAK